MDMSGAVIGVVVSKLNAEMVMEVTGDIPQNRICQYKQDTF